MRSDAISKTRNFREASAPRSSTALIISAAPLIVFVSHPRESGLAAPRLVLGERMVVRAAAGPSRRSGVSGVEGLAALGVCAVLRCLATVEFSVVAYDPCSSDPCLVIRYGSVLVRLRCSGVLPRYERNQSAGR
jgi:hypothetical protein